MSRNGKLGWIASALLLAGSGCGGYQYVRDVTPELEQSRQEYVQSNPENQYSDDILAGRVRKGMSRLQVRVTWGEPDEVTYKIPGGEIWSYSEIEPTRGTSVYNLLFDGEELNGVDVTRGGVSLTNTDPDMVPSTEVPLTTVPSSTSGKPEGGP
jgi:hypothetical protein